MGHASSMGHTYFPGHASFQSHASCMGHPPPRATPPARPLTVRSPACRRRQQPRVRLCPCPARAPALEQLGPGRGAAWRAEPPGTPRLHQRQGRPCPAGLRITPPHAALIRAQPASRPLPGVQAGSGLAPSPALHTCCLRFASGPRGDRRSGSAGLSSPPRDSAPGAPLRASLRWETIQRFLIQSHGQLPS